MPDHSKRQFLKENKESMIRAFLSSKDSTLVIIQYYSEELAFHDMILIGETIRLEPHGIITIIENGEKGKRYSVIEKNVNAVNLNMYEDKKIYTFSEKSRIDQICVDLIQLDARVYLFGYE